MPDLVEPILVEPTFTELDSTGPDPTEPISEKDICPRATYDGPWKDVIDCFLQPFSLTKA